MKQCLRCKEVKFWFQFHTEFTGLYTWVSSICRRCANDLKDRAVREYGETK